MNVEDNYCSFFEGTEKLLEVWFSRSDGDMEGCDVRKIPRASLESLLKLVKCEIISFKKNEHLDAYVLSLFSRHSNGPASLFSVRSQR